jgi:hypothetical protein
MMRKTLLAASCGIFFLFGADHASAEDPSSPFLKLCEADGNAAGASTADGPTEPETEKKGQAKPTRSTEDVALSERLQDLIANKLQQYVPRLQDRTAVEAFYRGRDFAPLWVNAGGPLPARLLQACSLAERAFAIIVFGLQICADRRIELERVAHHFPPVLKPIELVVQAHAVERAGKHMLLCPRLAGRTFRPLR